MADLSDHYGKEMELSSPSVWLPAPDDVKDIDTIGQPSFDARQRSSNTTIHIHSSQHRCVVAAPAWGHVSLSGFKNVPAEANSR